MSEKTNTTKKKTNQKKDIDKSKIKKYKQHIEKLEAELKEKNDKLLRTCADIQNIQKRLQKELLFKEDDTKKKYITELIDLYELLQKAFNDEKPKKGLELILQNLDNFFEKENIHHIDCKGKPFDHNKHHAISTIEKNDCEDNIIVEEIKKGYMINEKVLRPSQVIVVKNKDQNNKVVE